VSDSDNGKQDLPFAWQKVQGAIWLIGLAILAWQNWWWPGILILVAISSIYQAVVHTYVRRAEEEKEVSHRRETLLPENCPNCGSPITVDRVTWVSDTTASCPYCNSSIKATEIA
jgi:hypothetical protein